MMNALSLLTLEKTGAALYLHAKLASRALRAAEATDYLARQGVFEGRGNRWPEPHRKMAAQNPENMKERVWTSALSGLVGGQLGQLGAGAVAVPLALRAQKDLEQPVLNRDEVNRVRKLLRVPRNITLKSGLQEAWDNPHFDPVTNTIHARNGGSYGAAHEMGHASGFLGRKFTKYPVSFMYALGKNPLAGIISAAHAANQRYMKEKGTEAGRGSKLLADLDVAGKAGAGVMLAEEGQATARALRALSRVQGRAGLVGGAKALLPAYGTYLASVLGNHVVAPKMGDFMAGKLVKRQVQEKV